MYKYSMRNRVTHPKEVLDKLEELRSKTKNRLSLSKISNRFCVYEYKYIFNSAKRHNKMAAFYMGSITTNGDFIPAIHRKPTTKVQNLDEYINAMEETRENGHAYALVQTDEIDRAALTEISMDSRMSVNAISKKIGISANTVASRLRMLTKQFGIKKTIEVYPEKFGFIRYLITVKFLNKTPNIDALRKLFASEPRVQVALFMHGDLDLFIYIIVESTRKLENIIYSFRSDRVFAGFPAIWNVGYMLEAYGYVPLRDEFFELIKERVWKKTKESRKRGPDQLLMSEYAVLREMNKDAGISFAEIDRNNNLNKGSAEYTYHKLIGSKLIERPTITMLDPPIKYCALLYATQTDILSFNATRRNVLIDIIEETKLPTNKYVFEGDVSAPYGVAFIAPIYRVSAESLRKKIEDSVKGVDIGISIITDYIAGYLGFRRFDNKFSPQIKILEDIR